MASPAAANDLLKQGKAQDAWSMLLGLLQEDPSDLNVNALMVQVALATGRVNQAIAALERLVALRPQDPSLRVELAKAYAHVGDEAAAQAEMEQVRRLTPKMTQAEAARVLEQAGQRGRASRQLWQVSGSVSTGMVWDSNVNGGLDRLRLGGGNWLFVLDKDSGKTSAFGEYLNGSLNFGRRMNSSSPWWVVGDASFYGKYYNSTVPSNQYFAWNHMALGLRYVSSRHMVDIRAKGELSHHDPYDRMASTGVDLTYLYALTPSVQLMTKAGVDTRVYATSRGRNGEYWNAGQYVRFLWGKDASALVGARILGSEAREKRHSYSGWEAIARVSFSPLPRLTVAPSISWREQRYRDRPTWISILLKEGKRVDRTLSTGLFLTWSWTKELSSDLGWQYSRNYSNSTFYKYDQHQINMGLTYKF